uniref:uncharacterized protein LOC120885013 n=1 Tax=Ictidomys tridecemlineatus TaxID=43179 RepID=UPI001A9F6D56|nr:uncharacterized protein LOC120885013 [Ictidomys tridecemlineatus]
MQIWGRGTGCECFSAQLRSSGRSFTVGPERAQRNEKREGSGYCAACGGRIPTGGFPNIVFNFLKAARDPETTSPGAGDPGAGRAGEPDQSHPISATPRLRVGATWPLPAAAVPAPRGKLGRGRGLGRNADIEKPSPLRKSGGKRGRDSTQRHPCPPASARASANPLHPACSGGCRSSGAQSREEGGGKARIFVRQDPAGRRGAGSRPRLSAPSHRAQLGAAQRALLAALLPPAPLGTGRKHHARRLKPHSLETHLAEEGERNILVQTEF